MVARPYDVEVVKERATGPKVAGALARVRCIPCFILWGGAAIDMAYPCLTLLQAWEGHGTSSCNSTAPGEGPSASQVLEVGGC